MTDYAQEQEMEIEALEAILMDDFKEIHSSESGLNTSNRCFQIKVIPQFSFSSLRGIHTEDLRILKENLEQEASENLGMAMVYTLVSSAKEWLSERYGEDTNAEDAEAEEATKDDVIIPHGEPVTVETFLAWRERFEAELALERAKLMPESALTAPKEKRLSGRQWFESGRGSARGPVAVAEGSDVEDEEDIDFDDDDFEDDEEDMLEHYLAEKSESPSHS
ncbi:rwd domain-containing protein 1 [Quercus suber]|uniref:Rwd domain-containing protein 1 n=1 Tax=Quercus suber TaxID=58331 RepID=A0AAW0KZB2_QUESU